VHTHVRTDVTLWEPVACSATVSIVEHLYHWVLLDCRTVSRATFPASRGAADTLVGLLSRSEPNVHRELLTGGSQLTRTLSVG
jgi:hypothetical protein